MLQFLLNVADTIIDLSDIGLCSVAEMVDRNAVILYLRKCSIVEGFQGIHTESVHAFFDQL